MSKRTWATAVATIGLMLSGGANVGAIGPTVMMFHGPPLKAPVFVTGADTSVFGDLHRPAGAAARNLEGRAFVAVALFWGPASDPALRGIRDLKDLTPAMAWQHGRFYPPQAGAPAVFLTTAFTKGVQKLPATGGEFVNGGVVSSEALVILRRVGVLGAS